MSNQKPPEKPAAAPAVEQSLDDKIATAVSKALETAIPMGMMAAAQASRMPTGKAAPVFDMQRCPTCQQYAGTCRNQHKMMIVGPSNPRRWKSWTGCILNGVQYRSPDMNTPIPVPAENNFGYDVAQWEREEENLREGRMLSHNSGTLSGKGRSNTRAANPVGFRGHGGQE